MSPKPLPMLRPLARAYVGQPGCQMAPQHARVPPELQGLQDVLAGMADILGSIYDLLASEFEQGIVYNLTLNITSVNDFPVEFNNPLFALNMTNDGPGTLQYKLPDNGGLTWTDLQPTEILNLSFKRGVIGTLGLRVQGPAATVRLVGTY